MSKKYASEPLRRQFIVNNALASARIEGFTPSTEFVKSLLDYIQGHRNIDELIKMTKTRYKKEL